MIEWAGADGQNQDCSKIARNSAHQKNQNKTAGIRRT